MGSIIRDYFVKHRGFSKVWEELNNHKLVNASVLGLVMKLFDKKDGVCTFVVKTPSCTSEIWFNKYTISIDKTEILLVGSDSGNSLTFQLKNVIDNGVAGITTNMKQRTEIRIY